jgi:hypothetical protein
MGYIHEFEQLLAPMLNELDEVTRKEVLQVVKKTVVESYRNGIEAGKAACLMNAIEQHKAPAGHGSHTDESQEHYTPRSGAVNPQGRQSARREPSHRGRGDGAYRQ